jgi:hypothetical protein
MAAALKPCAGKKIGRATVSCTWDDTFATAAIDATAR